MIRVHPWLYLLFLIFGVSVHLPKGKQRGKTNYHAALENASFGTMNLIIDHARRRRNSANKPRPPSSAADGSGTATAESEKLLTFELMKAPPKPT